MASPKEIKSPDVAGLRYSVTDLFIAMTIAAMIFGLMPSLGGPSSTATVLGFVALIGLTIHALGAAPPNAVVLAWWFVLVMHVVLSCLAAAFPELA
jgi:hypothetical protein